MRTFSLNKRSDYFDPHAWLSPDFLGVPTDENITPGSERKEYTDEELLSDPVPNLERDEELLSISVPDADKDKSDPGISDTEDVFKSLDLSGFLGEYKEDDPLDHLITSKYPQLFSAVRNYLFLTDLQCDKQLLYTLGSLDKQKAILLLTAILRACEATGKSSIENTSPDIIDISEGMTKYFDVAKAFDNAPDRDDFWIRNTYILICRLGAGTIEEPLCPGVLPRCVYDRERAGMLLNALIEMWIYDDNVTINGYLFTNDKGFLYVDYGNEDSDRLSIESEHTVYLSKKLICDILDRYTRAVLCLNRNFTFVEGLLDGHVN